MVSVEFLMVATDVIKSRALSLEQIEGKTTVCLQVKRGGITESSCK